MIEIKKILVPTDLSEHASHALDYATELASTYGATIYLFHVVDIHWGGLGNSAFFPGPTGDYLPRLMETAETELYEMKEKIDRVEVEISVVTGAPHVEVVRFAKKENMDLIALATHGRTGLSHALIGSVAEKVVQMAPCPVLTIKHPDHKFALP